MTFAWRGPVLQFRREKIYSLHCVATTTKISELDDIFERFKRALQKIQNIPLIGLEMVANGFGTTAISPSTPPLQIIIIRM